MKPSRFMLTIVAAVASFSVSGANYIFEAGDDSIETKTCIAAAQDDVRKYRNTVQGFAASTQNENRLQKIIVNKLECNGQNIVQFASHYSAMDTAEYMSKFITTKVTVRRDISESILPLKEDLKDDIVVIVTAN